MSVGELFNDVLLFEVFGRDEFLFDDWEEYLLDERFPVH